ncbi:unnamed protein product [Ixodes pacificus]
MKPTKQTLCGGCGQWRFSAKLQLIALIGALSTIALLLNTYPDIFKAQWPQRLGEGVGRGRPMGRSGKTTAASTQASAKMEESTPASPTTTDDPRRAHTRYIVNTKQCQIPNVDPYDASVSAMIEKLPPIDCSTEFPKFTYSKERRIFIDHQLLPKVLRGAPAIRFFCCYRPFFRNQHPQSDTDNVFQVECIPLENGSDVHFEFVKVECYNKDILVYTNYHAFVHGKRLYERRFQEAFDPKQPHFQYSVLIVGVDGMSRLNAHRQFPKTIQYLKEEMSAIEMYGYTKVGDNTFPNLVPLLTGLRQEELSNGIWNEGEFLDKLPFVWKPLAKSGFCTLYAEDSPVISTFNYLKPGFLVQPTDYYFHPFIAEYEKALGRVRPLNCYECVGPESETGVVLDWLQSFVEHSLQRPSFAFSWINSLTHDDVNGGSRVDHLYKSFFQSLVRGIYIDNTIVVFMSDHGQRWGRIRNTYVGMLEDRLPMLFIRFPPTFRRHHPNIMRNIHINSRRLITPFDLHATLRNLVKFEGTSRQLDVDDLPDNLQDVARERAVSLFGEVSVNRTCRDAGIDEQWCVCRPSIAEKPENRRVKIAALSLLKHINGLLVSHKNICAEQRIRSIRSARVYTADPQNLGALDYSVTLETNPGNSVFEATVRVYDDEREPMVLGDISRLNIYKGKADCVGSASVKKFCFCVSNISTTF